MRKRAQVILELGLFGAILLGVVMVLISYLQRTNERQYITMKSFRKALDTAYFNCVAVDFRDPNDPDDDDLRNCSCCSCGYCDTSVYTNYQVFSAGGSVSMNFVEHRRQGSGDFFGKGTRSPSSSTSRVYWGVPFIWVNKTSSGDTEIAVQNLEQFQLYDLNGYKYNVARYYDQDGDGLNDWEDDDTDGDGILNTEDDDIDGNGVLDDDERTNGGLFEDVDGDGIPNWKDDDINGKKGPSIELVMDYQEKYRQTQTKTETFTDVTNKYESYFSDNVYVNFFDRNGVVIKSDGTTVAPDESLEGHQQSAWRQNGQYIYLEVPQGSGGYQNRRTITWTDAK